jgi:DNA-binding NarL/FixJ family response regulator
MGPARPIADLLAELRTLLSPRRRRTMADAAPLLASMLSACRVSAVEESSGRITFRFHDRSSAVRVTCVVHHSPTPSLTAAEAAVAKSLCEGRTIAQIASLRGVSVNTVKSQVRQLFRKLNVDSRVALVRRLGP